MSVYEKSIPAASVVVSILSLFAPGIPDWVRYLGVAVGVLLAIAWLVTQAGWLGKVIVFRLFRSKLSKEQAVRLHVLLDDINDYMSYSCTLSPFYVWHSVGNTHREYVRMNYNYHRAVSSWLMDLRDKILDPRNNNLVLISSLFKAISESARLAEEVEHDLNNLIRMSELVDTEVMQIKKEWDASRNQFNQWIDKWQTLFKEIDKSLKIDGNYYIRHLNIIG